MTTASAQSSQGHRTPILSTFTQTMPKRQMDEIAPGLVLVKLPANRADEVVGGTVAKLPGLAEGTFESRIEGSNWTLWRIPVEKDPRTVAAGLRGRPDILAAQPVNRVYPLWTDPNDPDFYVQEDSPDLVLALSEEGEGASFRRLWHLSDTNAEAAWGVFPNLWYTAGTKPANAPLISIIDTGCDMNHPDFANAGSTSTDTANGGQLDHARSAQFRLGRRYAYGSPHDVNGHGTHVTGLAVAAGNNGGFNGKGVIGTGYNSRAMICRVIDDSGYGTDADAAAAIYYSVNKGAEIISLSLGTENFSQLFQDAVTFAWQKGCLVVAAGNEDGNGGGDLGPIYPAACSGALAVTANGPDGVPAHNTYSGYGSYIDIAAPGGDVIQTIDNWIIQFVYSTSPLGENAIENNPNVYPPFTREYAYLAGTSMATPIVSGAAGLYYGYKRMKRSQGWSNVKAYRAIEMSAASVFGAPYGGWEPNQGFGCLDMWSMLMDYNARGATGGGAEGIVYYKGTAIQNVAIYAQKLTGGTTYSTTTNTHGIYRFEAMPPGNYKIWTTVFGEFKAKKTLVQAGSDMTGFDFWVGGATGDSTPPTVAKLVAKRMVPDRLVLDQWGYDTETGIDRVRVKIGTVAGGSDVLALREVVPNSNVLGVGGFTATPGTTYFITVLYTNGRGVSTSASTSIVATAS
ncbi:MAG TPA: S8 family serine peptidase [Fimbriimonas sp.]